MDGASKFVKGDAMAALLITAINVLVGLVMGVAIHGVPFSEAFHTYTLLTIGDGLVSQIPALIVSMAAGLLVSKGGVAGKTGAALGEQLGRYPKAFGMVSALMGALALLPGLVDTHVHLAFDASSDPVSSLAARSDDEVSAAMRHAAGVALPVAADSAGP